MMDPVFVGLAILLAGLCLTLLMGLVLRALSPVRGAGRRSKQRRSYSASITIPDNDATMEAVIAVEPGGRIQYANDLALIWFGQGQSLPGLEQIARRLHPPETLLDLCIREGQARFTLDGRGLDVHSYQLPSDEHGHVMLVVMRPEPIGMLTGDDGSPTNQALAIYAELSKKITAQMQLEPTLQAILETVERLVPADFYEITIWDYESHSLVPYRSFGTEGIDRRMERTSERYDPAQGYSGYLVSECKPLWIPDVEARTDIRPALDRQKYPFKSYLGVPLLVDRKPIGTLELASFSKETFSERELGALNLLAGHAAVALKTALLSQQEQQRRRELAGLSNLAQITASTQDPENLLQELVNTLSELFDVEQLGFLLYDDRQRLLCGKAPFTGIPAEVVDLIQFPIEADSPAEYILKSHDIVLAAEATRHPAFEALGLHHVAMAAGMREALLAPLSSGGRFLGYLLIANGRTPQPFGEEVIRLLSIVAGQIGPLLVNMSLSQEAQASMQRTEALGRIAQLVGSAGNREELLKSALQELAQQIGAELAVLYLLDEHSGTLQLHPQSLFGSEVETLRPWSNLPLNAPDFRQTVTSTRSSFTTLRAGEDERIQAFYRPLLEALAIESLIAVPLVVRDLGAGELLLASHSTGRFSEADGLFVVAAAGQLAGAIERAGLYTQTDEKLRRRVEELTSLTRISRELNTSTDLMHLLKRVNEESIRTTYAIGGRTLLFDPENRDAQKPALLLGDLANLDLHACERQVLETGQPLILQDTVQESAPPLAIGARSALLVPVLYQSMAGDEQARPVGAIHVWSETPGHFDQVSIEITQSLAVQAAIALMNALRYRDQTQQNEQLKSRMLTLSRLIDATRAERAEQPLDEALQVIVDAIRDTTPFNAVLLSLYDPDKDCLRRVAGAGFSPEQMAELLRIEQPWQSIQGYLQDDFRIGRTFFIPGERKPVDPPDVHIVYVLPLSAEKASETTWQADDLLLVPIYGNQGEPLGLISVDDPRDSRRPDRSTLEALELFTSQAGLMIQNHTRAHHASHELKAVMRNLEKAERSSAFAHAQLPMLLQKDLEQTRAMHSLSLRANRIQASLDIGEAINRQTDRGTVLLTLGQELVLRFGLDAALVAERSPGGPRLLHTLGLLDGDVNYGAMLGQRNPLRQSLQAGKVILSADLGEDAEWQGVALLQALEAKAFICIPVPGDTQTEAVVLGVQQTTLPVFTVEDERLFALIGRQASLALRNLQLVDETSRRLQEVSLLLAYSRDLGSLDPQSILKTLLENAMEVAEQSEAGVVLLFDEKRQRLTPQFAAGYPGQESVLQIEYASGEALPGKVFASGQPLRLDEVDFARDYNLGSENLLRYRDATQGKLPVSSLLVPIRLGEQQLGVVVLDNFRQTGAFNAEDLALINSLAQQTALALDNARLFQASNQRAQQLQALTEVAGTISSSLLADDVTGSLLQHLRSVVDFDTGTLWLKEGEKLVVRAADGFADREDRIGLAVALEDSLLFKAMVTSGQPIVVGNVRQDERFPALVEAEHLSWVGLPLIAKGEVIGVVALEKAESDFYTLEGVQVVTTFASQAAVSLINAMLFEDSLHRSIELDEQTRRLAALNQLSQSLSSTLDMERLLEITMHELFQGVSCSSISILLIDSSGQAALWAESPGRDEELPHLLPAEPLFEHLHDTLGVFPCQDVEQEELLEPLLNFLHARQTHSLLALPLATGNDLQGLVLLHESRRSARFNPDEIELARTICNQAAISIQNARLYAETQRRLNELAAINQISRNISATIDLDELFARLPEQLAMIIDTENFYLALHDDQEDLLYFPFSYELGEHIEIAPRPPGGLTGHIVQTGKPLLLVGDDVQEQMEALAAQQVGSLVAKSYLGVPLALGERVIGVIAAQTHERSNAFTPNDERLLSTVAAQIAVAIENSRLYGQVQGYASELEARVHERTQQLEQEHTRTQTLLNIITELSASLDMDIVLNRTLGLINQIVGAEQSTILLVEPGEKALLRRASFGYARPAPEGGEVTAMQANQGLAGWVIAHHVPTLIDDVLKDERWVQPSEGVSEHRSAIVTPLMVGEETLGVLMLFHRQPGQFSNDHLALVQATAKQIAVAINNSKLFRLIRDQAERLGDMLRTQHVETSRSQAILEAVADGVLVTDQFNVISLFNASAERILELDRRQVLAKSLENFTGLFGKAARAWMETIHAWSKQERDAQPAEIYAQKIELDDGRVVSVHLAPVRLRDEFLGTVSIFRDITHEVEVARMKSEFVANVSHELRTPMTSIKGYVDVLLMGASGELSDQQRNFLQIVKSNTERLVTLVNDLLDVSRLEAGKVSLSLGELDLAKLVREAVAEARKRVKDAERLLAVGFEIPQMLPGVLGDIERIRQVLDNLVDNAIHYTPAGGEITLRLSEMSDENGLPFVRVDVRDTGIGIPLADQERVFERFYRGEDPLVLETPGTGLGLSVVKSLVEMHQGRIWVYSSGIPGEGSMFSFTLPVYRSEWAAEVEKVSEQQMVEDR
jgi:PAS domain S-box-containing protein